MVSAPWTVKIAIDIDLTDNSIPSVMYLVVNQKMTEENWKDIIAFPEPEEGFKTAVRAYGCDICKKESNIDNPIYTNNKFQGVDICSYCMDKAFKTLEHIKGWSYGPPVYSLSKIVKCATKE